VTDIGNDILYGADVGQIAEWVEECLTRLRGKCEQIVITELPWLVLRPSPRGSIERFVACCFPGSR